MGGKVLIPTAQHVKHLCAARLAADVCGVPTVLIARTDAESARLMTSDVDERDHEFIDRTQSRTTEGFYQLKDDGLNCSIKRAIAFAPYCDMIWMETATPDLNMARQFAEAVKRVYPNKMLAYNCSPSFNWAAKLPQNQLATFQRELGAMGYKFQFVTLAGFHANNFGMFELAHSYKRHGMAAYSELQQREFKAEPLGYTAVKHQREVGTGFFDDVATVVAGGRVSTRALVGSTEEAQFNTNATTSDLASKIPVTTTAPLTQQPRLHNARAFATQGGATHTAEVSQPTDNLDCFVHKLL
jgi:isocitrate lyase